MPSPLSTLAAVAGAIALVATGTAPAVETAPAWTWPTPGSRVVLRPFVAPPTPYGAGHRGVDLLAEEATVVAPADGVVRFAGMVAGRPVLSIDHGGGVVVSVEPVASELVAGAAVARGDPIGVALPGHCDRPCIHLGVRVDGEYANPLRWLGGAVRPILLPTRHPAGSAVSAPVAPQRPPRARAPATRSAPARASRAPAR